MLVLELALALPLPMRLVLLLLWIAWAMPYNIGAGVAVGVCVCSGIGIGDGVVVVVMDFSRRGEPANTILLELISVLVSLNVFFISVCEEGQKLFDVVVSEPCSCHFFLSGALPTGVSSNM